MGNNNSKGDVAMTLHNVPKTVGNYNSFRIMRSFPHSYWPVIKKKRIFTEDLHLCTNKKYKDCGYGYCKTFNQTISYNPNSPPLDFNFKGKYINYLQYNHIPAQLQSLKNVHVLEILTFHEGILVLMLERKRLNVNNNINLTGTLFALADVERNKFLGVFESYDKLITDVRAVKCQISPDKSRVALKLPRSAFLAPVPAQLPLPQQTQAQYIVNIYDISASETSPAGLGTNMVNTTYPRLLSFCTSSGDSLFAFDPRYGRSRIFFSEVLGQGSVSLVRCADTGSYFDILAERVLDLSSCAPPQAKHNNTCCDESIDLQALESKCCKWHPFGQNLQRSSLDAESVAASGSSVSLSVESAVYSNDGLFLVLVMVVESLVGGGGSDGTTRSTPDNVGCVCAARDSYDSRVAFHHGARSVTRPLSRLHYRILGSDTLDPLRTLTLSHWLCPLHDCISSFKPIFSSGGTEFAIAGAASKTLTLTTSSGASFYRKGRGGNARTSGKRRSAASLVVLTYRLPPADNGTGQVFDLQTMCRAVVRGRISSHNLAQNYEKLGLPPKLKPFLLYRPRES